MNYDDMISSIVPYGAVNLNSSYNSKLGNVFDVWKENASVCIVLKERQRAFDVTTPRYRVVIRAVIPSNQDQTIADVLHHHPINSTHKFKHALTSRSMGVFTVIGVVPHSKSGHQKIKQLIGKSTVSFSQDYTKL